MTTEPLVNLAKADEEFARKMADMFLPDMNTPLIGARHVSIMAVVKNGIIYGRRTANQEDLVEIAKAAYYEGFNDGSDVALGDAAAPKWQETRAYRAAVKYTEIRK